MKQGEEFLFIGASTGGPKALHAILPILCQQIKVPIVIVQHMPPYFVDIFVNDLNAQCIYQVKKAENGDILNEKIIFISPGDQHLIIKKFGDQIRLELDDSPAVKGCKPSLDTFLFSANRLKSLKFIAVVLSGMGSDGLEGARECHKNKIPVIVQDEKTSVVWGMPGSIAYAGIADQIIPLEQIPNTIIKEVANKFVISDPTKAIQDYIYKICGILIPEGREIHLERRLNKLAHESGCSSYLEYFQKGFAEKDPTEQEKLVTAITTNETSFFRDPQIYKIIQFEILPKIVKNLNKRREKNPQLKLNLKILSAGTSTGEEAFSLAITAKKFIKLSKDIDLKLDNFRITGIDISTKALITAKSGKFSKYQVSRGLNRTEILDNFAANYDKFKANDDLRRIIAFYKINLVKDFSKMEYYDLILCRNVLIYFNNEQQEQIIKKFYERLLPGGFLILGSSEMIKTSSSKFDIICSGSSHYYKKN